jgi:hypothetical protein
LGCAAGPAGFGLLGVCAGELAFIIPSPDAPFVPVRSGTKVPEYFLPAHEPYLCGAINHRTAPRPWARRDTVTKREAWTMFKALQDFNRRLEALALEVTGLRALVNIQARQLAAVQAVRPVAKYTTTRTATTRRCASGAD